MQNNSDALPSSAQGPQQEAALVDVENEALPPAVEARLAAVEEAGRFHGITLDRGMLRIVSGETPSAAMLGQWAKDCGLAARGLRLSWGQLMKMKGTSPLVMLFKDGGAGLMVGVDPQRKIVFMKDPLAPRRDDPIAIDELRLSQAWDGDTLLIRSQRGVAEEDAPFNFSWLLGMVLKEKRNLVDIGVASITLSVLTIIPPMLVMTVIDKVIAHQSMSTLLLVSLILLVCVLFETVLGYTRREITQIVAARLDAKLALHIFNRLLALPLEYFEQHPAGETTQRLYQVFRIRDFMTGKLLQTFLDFFTLIVLLPFLFYLSATLTWMVIGISVLITLTIVTFLNPMRRAVGKVVVAEIAKNTVMVETVHGIRTVKSMGLEPQQKEAWDVRAAVSARARLAAGRLSNWPNTIVTPLERFIDRGVLLIGAYLALTHPDSGVAVGSLVAFMMLGGRVAAPLVGMARLLEDFEEVRTSVGEVGAVLNNPNESNALQNGLRPKFAGAISFDNVQFTYPGSKTPALCGVTFSVPAGTMLGLVGRSGSGKSTITRLLQGINRDYEGYVKIDGSDLREINLHHLRRSFGVVLQDNFLFRGTIRENIIAGRPGLTLEDVVRAARLAGAEEFIERMPQGYETFIQEGSANLSGGQRQRLAIARALISDPRLMILDEATSALDPESEALVNANLVRIGKGRTMVIVSHRLASLTECDLIVVMDQGRVEDMAPHKVLLERCTIYRQLWNQQNRHMEAAQKQGPVASMLAQGD
ncbi:Type I protein secretion transmembrane subunit [Granulibacter bethesdensis]|uniref:peptidase domain-containing ABC transporter n=1 Tax=Granulibacter bethesdensis TaxID=364410 RepID=UPI00090CC252|nr:peptidase domain-containing ABC transporter [Granulibacter bethesdensis]APH55975.1 Type I protein secretion transmembrane subunit [Granulibacter bethesdensis]